MADWVPFFQAATLAGGVLVHQLRQGLRPGVKQIDHQIFQGEGFAEGWENEGSQEAGIIIASNGIIIASNFGITSQ